jgi:Uma2 family endonuclease
MSTLSSKTFFTPDDLLLLPDAINYELVDGKLVERPMGLESSQIAGKIITLLNNFLGINPIGDAFGPDASYQCFPDTPDMIRKPDVSFIRAGRLPKDHLPEGHCKIAPDLAVEVLSPNDLARDVARKVREYLAAGIKLVWIVDPDSRFVQVHRPRGNAAGVLSGFGEADILTGEDVLPGFCTPVADFFRR